MKLIPQLSIDVIVSASVGALFYYKATLSTNHTSTPIFMTTAVTILGHFSLVFMLSAGAEVLNSIGIILVAGMAMGTFFCLFLLSKKSSY